MTSATIEKGKFQVMSGLLNEQALRSLVGDRLETTGGAGHLTVRWDGKDKDDVKAAERTFKDLTGKGYRAFKMNEVDESKGEQVDDFDPDARAYIFIPPVKGG